MNDEIDSKIEEDVVYRRITMGWNGDVLLEYFGIIVLYELKENFMIGLYIRPCNVEILCN